jgi:hypothetical protein
MTLGFIGVVSGGSVSFRKRLSNGTLQEMTINSKGSKVYTTLETLQSSPSYSEIGGLSAPRFKIDGQVMPDFTTREVAMQHMLNVYVHDLLVAAEDPRSLATRAELYQLGQRVSALVSELSDINDELTSFGY